MTMNSDIMRWQTTTDDNKDDYQVQQKVTIVNSDLPTYLFCQLTILTQMIYDNFNNMPVTKHGTQTVALKLIHRLLVQRRGWVWWLKSGCPPHQHPSFTRCFIHRSAHPPFTIIRLHTSASVTKQYNLVPVKGWKHSQIFTTRVLA